MYLPTHFAIDDPALQLSLLRRCGFGRLVTAVGGRLESTAVPFVLDDAMSMLRCHLARANGHWRDLDGADALLIASLGDAYVSPRWYPTKEETGAVVPTWNYLELQVRGTLRLHHDRDWLRAVVNDLTDVFERSVPAGRAWQVDDAPAAYVDGMLGGIVGVELQVRSVEAKAKLSQNRALVDRLAVAGALEASSETRDRVIASLMAELAPITPP